MHYTKVIDRFKETKQFFVFIIGKAQSHMVPTFHVITVYDMILDGSIYKFI